MANKKFSLFKVLPKTVAIVIIVVSIIYSVINYFNEPPHIKYLAFGIDIPQGYGIHGIDVSRYQKIINWKDVKEMEVKNIKIGFAFIKATEGTESVDQHFRKNWAAAQKVSITKGAYHYFIAGESGKAQAKNFTQIVKLKVGDLPPVLDVEEIYKSTHTNLLAQVNDWLAEVENYYSVKPIIYSNVHFYNKYLTSLKNYPVWIAHYNQRNKPRTDNEWLFWQHNEKGRVNGIKTPVDFNVFAGDSFDFKNLLIK